ncbi:hypothetical protein KFZ56_03620 [Virgibacillus sp. NKC19-3]|uniref:hypothetical protein n=1 Tax=Virgibacillus saliphilus TaxID=2831674 RepID=UPI001C9AEA02|nr:hypothetical protein [Virgibacillus sp. NKC19-3]MBY7142194.1 hypothetical protein [Virgibacillus sp. NKC19-3]
MINKRLSQNFEVKENYYTNLKFNALAGKVMRFLLPSYEFKDFANVYIGDVDFLIINEHPSLLESHLDHCQQISLPYSNQIRPGSKRLTGLHFYQVDEYYEKMNSAIQHYVDDPEKITQAFQTLKRDEEFLYQMIEKNIGFRDMKKYHYRPHHGFHLGILRKGSAKFRDYVREGPKNPFHRLPEYPVLRKQLLQYYNDPLFQDIENTHRIQEVQLLRKLIV